MDIPVESASAHDYITNLLPGIWALITIHHAESS